MTKRVCEGCRNGNRPIKNKSRYCDACAQMPLPFYTRSGAPKPPTRSEIILAYLKKLATPSENR
jgi:hypothetical protein